MNVQEIRKIANGRNAEKSSLGTEIARLENRIREVAKDGFSKFSVSSRSLSDIIVLNIEKVINIFRGNGFTVTYETPANSAFPKLTITW